VVPRAGWFGPIAAWFGGGVRYRTICSSGASIRGGAQPVSSPWTRRSPERCRGQAKDGLPCYRYGCQPACSCGAGPSAGHQLAVPAQRCCPGEQRSCKRPPGPVWGGDVGSGSGARGTCDRNAAEPPRSGATRAFRQRGERACHAPRAQITTPYGPWPGVPDVLAAFGCAGRHDQRVCTRLDAQDRAHLDQPQSRKCPELPRRTQGTTAPPRSRAARLSPYGPGPMSLVCPCRWRCRGSGCLSSRRPGQGCTVSVAAALDEAGVPVPPNRMPLASLPTALSRITTARVGRMVHAIAAG
jgi:hypothetical protein